MNLTLCRSCKLHLDNRLRLKLNVTNPDRQVFRGNELIKSEPLRVEDFHIINEVVIDRGPSPYAIQIELMFDGNYMTTLIGDGIIISTPTGSTAYNMSAGGSIVMSNTECICITPLAPHSLSFRPLIIPASTKITIKKTQDNRNTAWVSMDGATRFILGEDEELTIQGSKNALSLVVNPSDNLTDLWGQRLVHMFNWNKREQMKALQKQQTYPYK